MSSPIPLLSVNTLSVNAIVIWSLKQKFGHRFNTAEKVFIVREMAKKLYFFCETKIKLFNKRRKKHLGSKRCLIPEILQKDCLSPPN